VAIVGLVVWILTVAAGIYLLITSTRAVPRVREVPAPPPVPVAAKGAGTRPDKNRFDPPSLARAKAEPLPGLRALGEFAHPLLGITGFGLFVGYVLIRAWIIGALALGVGVGALAAGLSWAIINIRAARREPPDENAMTFTPRLLILHGAGAAVTILIAALIVARV
jgi:hypothetical protein